MSTTDPEAGLSEATRLTDALDDPEVLEAAAASIESGVRETLRLGVQETGAEASRAGYRMLAGIGLAFRRAGTQPERAAPPSGLFEWGPLTVLRRIGEGQFGEVYAAWDSRLQREVALKLRRPQAGALRWLDEARSLARVQHPNVVTVFGADLASERAGIWMQLVRGETLESFLQRSGPLDVKSCLRIGRDLASALAAVHRAGLLHGDLKAANVMIESVESETDGDGARRSQDDRSRADHPRVVLMDFGAASRLSGSLGPRFGTPLSTAPEVIEGKDAQPSSDVYSLGVLLYRMLAGSHPLEAATLDELRAARLAGRRVPLASARTGLPAKVVRVIESAADDDPERRTATAARLRDDLARLLGEHVPRIPPAILAGGIVSTLAALGIGWVLWTQIEMRNTNRYRRPPEPRLAISRVPWWTSGEDHTHRDFGWTMAVADFDGDGRQDLVLADPGYTGAITEQGSVQGHRGTPAGLAKEPAFAITGGAEGARLGWSLEAAGDFDGDHRADIVTSDCLRHGETGRVYGNIRVLLSSRPPGSAPLVLPAEMQVASFATHTCSAGDLDGDGFDDLAATEQNWNGEHRNQGRVRVYRGGPAGPDPARSWTLSGDPQGSAFGTFVVGLGDANGDGLDDVLVGAGWWHDRRGETGAAHLFLGSKDGPVAAPRHRVTGDRGGDLLGAHRSLAALGDVNGDGLADFAVGVLGHDQAGMDVGEVRVYAGAKGGFAPTPIWHAQGFVSGGQFGCSIAGGADVDGDGINDLLVGNYGFGMSSEQAGSGAVFLYRGTGDRRAFERTPAWWVALGQPEALFGASVAMADFDGDGHAEIIAGAPRWRDGPTQVGRVVVYRGAGLLPARAKR